MVNEYDGLDLLGDECFIISGFSSLNAGFSVSTTGFQGICRWVEWKCFHSGYHIATVLQKALMSESCLRGLVLRITWLGNAVMVTLSPAPVTRGVGPGGREGATRAPRVMCRSNSACRVGSCISWRSVGGDFRPPGAPLCLW